MRITTSRLFQGLLAALLALLWLGPAFSALIYMPTSIAMPERVYKLMAFGGLILGFSLSGTPRVRKSFFVPGMLILLISTVILAGNIPLITDRIGDLIAFFSLLIFLVVSTVFRLNFDISTLLVRMLLWAGVPLAGLGLYQYVSNTPLFIADILASQGGSIQAATPIWDYFGQTRAYGLFMPVALYAGYMILVTLLCLSLGVQTRSKAKRVLYGLYVLLGMAALYATILRTAWLQAAVSVAVLGVIFWVQRQVARGKLSVKTGVRQIMSVGILAAALAVGTVLYQGVAANSTAQNGGIYSTDSLSIRLRAWEQLRTEISPKQWLLGSLTTSNSVMIRSGTAVAAPEATYTLLVDNGYLWLAIFGGVPFALAFLAYFLIVLSRTIRQALLTHNYVIHAFAAYIFGLLAGMLTQSVMDLALTTLTVATLVAGFGRGPVKARGGQRAPTKDVPIWAKRPVLDTDAQPLNLSSPR